MTREALLNAAVKEFQDKQNKAYVYQYKNTYTKDGYSYLAIDYKTKREITCAIHLGTEKSPISEGGKAGFIPQQVGVLSTREKLLPNELVKYKDNFLFWKSFVDYNETMGQYLYEISVLLPSDKILLSKITDAVSHTCYDKISTIPNYAVLPFYADLTGETFESSVILLNCQTSNAINIAHYNPIKKTYEQQRADSVSFYLFNMTRLDSMKFIDALQEYSLSSKNFGFLELPYIVDEPQINEFNSTQAIISKIYAKISYNLVSSYERGGDKLIRTALYKCYNIDLERENGKEN